jgi:hypothetical protein
MVPDLPLSNSPLTLEPITPGTFGSLYGVTLVLPLFTFDIKWLMTVL